MNIDDMGEQTRIHHATPCAGWPECGCASDTCTPACNARAGQRESPLPEGAALVVLIAIIVALSGGFILWRVLIAVKDWLALGAMP